MASILTALASNTTMLLGSLIADEISLLLGVNSEIKKLKRKIDQMTEVITEAEQTAIQNAETKYWLKQWKDIMYEAGDIIDRCRIEAWRRGASQPDRNLERNVSSVLNCRVVAIDCHIAKAIRNLNTRMEEISRNRPTLAPRQITDDRTTGSYRYIAPELEPDIVGADIEKDTTNLISLLLREDEKRYLLFAVVGSIGVGKTTLARKIYHNEEICHAFPNRLWICISKSLNCLTMWQGGSSMREERIDIEQVGNLIAGQKFLLVVDDIWTVEIWESLLETRIEQSGRGARVLITTRYKNVAKRMGAVHIHHVKKLNEDDGWSLLCIRASLNATDETQEMQDVGRRIVQKCDGLPMAIRSIGGILREKDARRDEWENVCNCDFWFLLDDVSRAINLSYQDLGSHQKQCFLYCGLFPESFVFEQRYITQQWISEGFVEIRQNSTLEELAEQYYKELIARGLLQLEHRSDNVIQAKMPHILQSFARHLSKDENFTGDLQYINDVFGPRHLSLANKEVTAIPNEISRLKSLRTLLLFQNKLENDGLEDAFKKLTLLRVLDLHDTPVEAVPKTLVRLVHLRYLNLSNTKIRELPDTIKHLRALHFLILKGCPLNSLPGGIGQLRNLRSLDISRTELNHVPFSFEKLDELNCLQGFLVTNNACQLNGWPLQKLRSLSKLTSLSISRLEMCLNKEEASKSALWEKHYLKELELCCSSDARPMEVLKEVERITGIFRELCPPTCLESLKLVNYYGHEYPLWIPTLRNLQRLDFRGCLHCQRLPPLGQLPHLRFLAITGSDALHTIGAELRGIQPVAFPKLEHMQIGKMQNLQSWSGLRDGDLPSLQKFRLERCPSLSSLPSVIGHSTVLTSLQILDSDSLEEVKNLPVLKELTVVNNRNLGRLSALPALEVLVVNDCQNLNTLQGAPSLRHLRISGRHLRVLPKWLGEHASTLQRLEIVGTRDLLSRYSESSPDRPLIEGIAHVYGTLPDNTLLLSYTRSASMVTVREGNHPVPRAQSTGLHRYALRTLRLKVKEFGEQILAILLLSAVQYFIGWYNRSSASYASESCSKQ